MLRLVHPAKQGQGTRPPSRRQHGGLLTEEESKRLKAAMKNLRRAYGGWDVIAAMTGFSAKALQLVAYKRRNRGTAAHALAMARIAGIPVEQLLSGRPVVVGACAVCGRKGAP